MLQFFICRVEFAYFGKKICQNEIDCGNWKLALVEHLSKIWKYKREGYETHNKFQLRRAPKMLSKTIFKIVMYDAIFCFNFRLIKWRRADRQWRSVKPLHCSAVVFSGACEGQADARIYLMRKCLLGDNRALWPSVRHTMHPMREVRSAICRNIMNALKLSFGNLCHRCSQRTSAVHFNGIDSWVVALWKWCNFTQSFSSSAGNLLFDASHMFKWRRKCHICTNSASRRALYGKNQYESASKRTISRE